MSHDIENTFQDEPGCQDLSSKSFVNVKGIAYGIGIVALGFMAVFGIVNSNEDQQPTKENRQNRITVADRVFEERVYVTPEEVDVIEHIKPEVKQEIVERVVVKHVYHKSPVKEIPKIHKGRSRATQSTQSQSAPVNAQASVQQASALQTSSIGSDGVELGHATKLEDLDRKILAFTSIPCDLNSAIITQLSGDASCTVSRDIYSADRTRLLIPRYSQMYGSYGIATTSAAVTRIGLVWTRLVTTDNNTVNMDSPATSQQGAAGIKADDVNYHFWAKFGNSIAISLIENTIAALGSTGNSTGDVVVNSATGSASTLASQILGQTVNLPATRSARASSPVAVSLRKDIIFP